MAATTAPVAGAGPAARPPAPEPQRRRDLRRSFTITFVLVVVLAAFLSPLLRGRGGVAQDARPDVRDATRRSWPSLPQQFELEGRRSTYTSCRCPTGGPDARARQAGPPAERVHRPGEPRRRHGHLAGLVADADPRLDALARVRQNFADVWDLIDFPRLLFNTIAIALIGMVGDGRLVHARGVRVRAVPVPRPRRSCSRSSSPRSSCRPP